MLNPLILIVEDEEKLARLLEDYLDQANFRSQTIYHGDDVMPWLSLHSVDAILLDLMLPGKDGLTLCREIRNIFNVPILMVTAKVDEIDRLLGLELGADDYICKPYSPREVVSRIKAVLRRSQQQSDTVLNGIMLDDAKLQLHYCGNHCEFTTVEYQLIKQLVSESGRILSRSQLMDNMYNDHRIVSDRTIDSHIKKIRRKLMLLNDKQEFIHSVYGAGYRFEIA
tara:strand:+ start:923 stop:1597 length:675 start_codon:yes stop_codon:yes gene_type:complete